MLIGDFLALYFEADRLVQEAKDECAEEDNGLELFNRASFYLNDFTDYLYRLGNDEGHKFFKSIVTYIDKVDADWTALTPDKAANYLLEMIQELPLTI